MISQLFKIAGKKFIFEKEEREVVHKYIIYMHAHLRPIIMAIIIIMIFFFFRMTLKHETCLVFFPFLLFLASSLNNMKRHDSSLKKLEVTSQRVHIFILFTETIITSKHLHLAHTRHV